MNERNYYRATDGDVVYRVVIDEATETFMGYFARPGFKSWGRNHRLISEITMGDVGAEPITRDEALEILKKFEVAPDDFDQQVSVET